MGASGKSGQEMLSAKKELFGVGVVVENVQWGPRGAGKVVAGLVGWGMRASFLVVILLLVVKEMQGWQEYPFSLRCFLYVVGVLMAGMMLWLMVTNPCEVKKEDVLKVPPREAVTWTWCSYCCLLRPPGSMHCLLCHCCIAGIDHHCFVLWRCIGQKSLPVFIALLVALTTVMFINFLMIKEAFVSMHGFEMSYLITLIVLVMLIHSILRLGAQEMLSPPQVYDRSAFVVRAPYKLTSVTPFTFNFSGIPFQRGELLKMIFRPLAASKTLPKPKKVNQYPQCSNNKCRALANPFWVTGASDTTLECNMCQAAVSLPENTKAISMSHDLFTEMDVHCLVHCDQARVRPRLVFVLDGTVPNVRTCIHRWAAATHDLPDVEVLCYKTRTCPIYTDGKVQVETMDGSLSTLVQHAWVAVAAHGGRVVFISGQQKSCLKVDVLDALVVAAFQVPLDIVCVSRLGVDRNPLLHPLVIHHQGERGGFTRVVDHSRDVLNLVRSGVFLFWGVKAHGTVRWTPGIEIVKVHGKGATTRFHPNTDSFFMACLDQERQVEFSLKVNPDKVLHRRRLSESEDNTVYFQLQMLYTNPQGMAALCVFNRMFILH